MLLQLSSSHQMLLQLSSSSHQMLLQLSSSHQMLLQLSSSSHQMLLQPSSSHQMLLWPSDAAAASHLLQLLLQLVESWSVSRVVSPARMHQLPAQSISCQHRASAASKNASATWAMDAGQLSGTVSVSPRATRSATASSVAMNRKGTRPSVISSQNVTPNAHTATPTLMVTPNAHTAAQRPHCSTAHRRKLQTIACGLSPLPDTTSSG